MKKKYSPLSDQILSRGHGPLGQQLIGEGKLGVLLLAGGQGSRLGFDGPKGCFPLFEGKSLFELFAEQVEPGVRVVIITSPQNHAETVAHFEQHNFFGIDPEFVEQGMLPLLSQQGEPIPEAYGPDGNGGAFHIGAEVLVRWKAAGVEFVNVVMVDNPLADPCDPELVGTLAASGNELLIKATERRSIDERVGVLVATERGVEVVEYSEGSLSLEYRLANLGLFCCTLDFALRVADGELPPLHIAHKKFGGIPCQKRERFLFDLFHQAQGVGVVVYTRKECFAPVKNATGEDSPQTARQALLDKQKKA